jgi:uncharacterized protein YegP (UPF0339 family)
MKYVVKISWDKRPYWIFSATNGQVIVTSETFNSSEACYRGIRSSKTSTSNTNFEVKVSIDSKYYFVQKANNHEVLCVSELYESRQACINSITILQRNAQSAPIV